MMMIMMIIMMMIVGLSPNQSLSKEASRRKSVRKLIFLGEKQKDEKCVLFEKPPPLFTEKRSTGQ